MNRWTAIAAAALMALTAACDKEEPSCKEYPLQLTIEMDTTWDGQTEYTKPHENADSPL